MEKDPDDRKIGQRKENYDGETTPEVLKKTKPLIRSDWGGKDAIEQIKKKMSAHGIVCGDKSSAAILEIVKEQIEGVRKRMTPRLDAVIKRISDEEAIIEETLE